MSTNSLGFLHSDFDSAPVRVPAQTRGNMYAHVLGVWRGSGRRSHQAYYVIALLERLVVLTANDAKHPSLLDERQKIEWELDACGAIVAGFDMRVYTSLGSKVYFDDVLSRVGLGNFRERARGISGNVESILTRLVSAK